jgi:hypothetical protein
VRVFLSCEAGPAAFAVLARALRAVGTEVRHSPTTAPWDPRWDGWYDHGCSEELRLCDAFVAVITRGHDSSTWMAIEADTALALFSNQGRPQPFIARLHPGRLAVAFARLEEVALELPVDPAPAAERILASLRS